MPRKPNKPCSHLGCLELTDKRYCPTHRKEYGRASAASRGYDYKWLKAQKHFWDVGNWQALCEKCHDKKTRMEGQIPVYSYQYLRRVK